MEPIKKLDSPLAGIKSSQPADKEEAKVAEAGKQFESLFLHQMLTAMTANTGKDELFGNSREQEFSRDMYNQALAENIAEGKGIGIKEMLIRENAKKTGKLPYPGDL